MFIRGKKYIGKMLYDLVIAGFGGQGILLIGQVLAHAAMREGKDVTFLNAYGVEQRGGTANCIIIISDEEIGSPITKTPCAAVVMNEPSFLKFAPAVKSEGLLMVNSSLIDIRKFRRSDLDVISIPATEIASEINHPKGANMVILGAFLEQSQLVRFETVQQSLREVLPQRYHATMPANLQALERGAELLRSTEVL